MEFTIRRIEAADHEAVRKLYSGPRVRFGTLQLPFPSAELWRKRLSDERETHFNLVALTDEQIVGNLALDIASNPRRRHCAHLGMAVRDDWQGQGVGSALMVAAIDLADNWLNLVRIELSVFTDNEAAIALYEKHGFVIEGRQACFAFRAGLYVDAFVMARVRADAARAATRAQ